MEEFFAGYILVNDMCTRKSCNLTSELYEYHRSKVTKYLESQGLELQNLNNETLLQKFISVSRRCHERLKHFDICFHTLIAIT